MIADPNLLRNKEREGRNLLQMRPIDRETYVQWSDSTREAVGSLFGGGSALVRELIAARRRISVTYETDPSYYLTQLAANLRRELAVVRKCIGRAGEEIALSAEASPSMAAAPRAPARKTAVARSSRLLVIPGKSRRLNEKVLSALESERVLGVSLPADAGKLSAEIGRDSTDDFALVVVSDPPQGAAASQELGFTVGFLAGLLGPDRVCVLRSRDVEPLFAETGVADVSLEDSRGWSARVLEWVRDGRALLRRLGDG